MLTFDDEDDLLADIEEGAALALEQAEVSDEAFIDDIKLNKIAWFCIQEFDLEITYGWFKYGPAPIHADTSKGGEIQTVGPKNPSELTAPREARVSSLRKEYRSPSEYAYFLQNQFKDEFKKIVESETKEYLVGFYTDHAPPEYKHLYIENIKLQQPLDELRSGNWFEESGRAYDEIEAGLRNTYREILKHPMLSETNRPYQRYSRLLRHVLIAAYQHSSLSRKQQQFIERLVDFYYGVTWEYVAQHLSKETVTGANKGALKSSIEQEIRVYRNTYDTRIERLKTRAERHELLPEAVEERRELEEDDNHVPTREPSTAEMDAWTSLASEVVLNDCGE